MVTMKDNCLSIFVDESGDFGFSEGSSDCYLFTMVLHDQANSIAEAVNHLEFELSCQGYCKRTIHSGPIIRREEDYKHFDLDFRRQLFYSMRKFARHVPVKTHTIISDKKYLKTSTELQAKISKELGQFVLKNNAFFSSYQKIILYYDNGQVELGKVLNSSFNTLLDVETRVVEPSDYHLFQLADFVCTIELINYKKKNDMLSRSEKMFFYKEKEFEKQFLNEIRKLNF